MELKIIIGENIYKFDKLTRVKDKIYNEANEKIENKELNLSEDEKLDIMEETLVKMYDNQFTIEDLETLEVTEIMGNFMNIYFYKSFKLNKYLEDSTKGFTQGKRKK